METRPLPIWRSLLYVPVNVDRFVEKAHLRGADCIQLDLEDSVPPAEKAAARLRLPAAVTSVSRGGADVLVRINRPLREAVRDLEAAVSAGLTGITLPKVESSALIGLLDEAVSELEAERGLAPGHTRFLALIENAAGLANAEAIAGASPRLAALELGSEDFAATTGIAVGEETLTYPKQRLVFAARAAGILPLGFLASIAHYGDQEAFRAMVRRSRDFGFLGASCIHPDQVAVLNQEYRPRAEEIATARRVIETAQEAAAAGRGSLGSDGMMLDAASVARARGLLDREAAIRTREEKARGR